ncbi:MAG: phosphoribosylformylglycinamidine synthase subunit PurL [Rickettsiales bacterium]|jgi:phosphoribosylformylglycinamidine synthase subunit PurL|nr:phosphoribosylformylglycinamidine synthase subunit PurL [Rickettsiales bacterium]
MKQALQSEISDFLAATGLKVDEYKKIIELIGREPNLTELGIFSAMWSEHCSYKSTRYFLKQLHTKEDWVICGPGENAGIIDIGDNDAIIFKMESHNHPSFIEPYQGAATGVGGILRDVFTMGARPIAVLDSLFFGDIDHEKTAFLESGVVAGVGGYGNCVGVPNIGGDTTYHESYNGNILVNAMCVGHAKADKIFYSAASEVGSSVMYVGAKTGRDGIHGASMASQEFDDESASKRPTVQVGDPFKEKLLIESCLELMQHDAILAIQDMGAAGLTSSAIEMASNGRAGIDLNLDNVPQRESNMSAFEMMLSESQERMLIVLKPGKESLAKEIFSKWDLDCHQIGTIIEEQKLILRHKGEIVADLPISPLADSAPEYQRPHHFTKADSKINADLKLDSKIDENLIKILAHPNLTPKNHIYEQYDSGVMNDTLKSQGIGAGIVRIHGTDKAVSVTTDCNPRYVAADAYMGASQAVVATYRNLIVQGAKPLAITNCLNFGNPEKSEIMGQIVSSINAIKDASKYLKYPVVSGNVSLYNETNQVGIQPTPNIGGVGLISDINKIPNNYFVNEGEDIFVIGETKGHLGCSIYLKQISNSEEGLPPAVDLATELKTANFITKLIDQAIVTSVNDVSDGGILTLVYKMAKFGKLGYDLTITESEANMPLNQYLFAEDQARYIATGSDSNALLEAAKAAGIAITKIGVVKSN